MSEKTKKLWMDILFVGSFIVIAVCQVIDVIAWIITDVTIIIK